MAVSGTRRSIAARKFARNRVWHTLGSVRKQSQCTIAFHYIDLRAAVTGTRRRCPRRGRAYYRDSSSSPDPPVFPRVSRPISRVLRSPPSFPFPTPINNFIRRSRERAAVVNYRAARRANLKVERQPVPISTFRQNCRRTGKPPILPISVPIEEKNVRASCKIIWMLPPKRNMKNFIINKYQHLLHVSISC